MRPLVLALALLAASCAPAQSSGSDAIYTSWRNSVAAGGYDVVSYFQNAPQRGDREFTYAWKGAEWRFSTEANRDLFAINPEAFAPQYGGYCAWAMAHGKLARGTPDHWRIEDGRLYLNFNDRVHRLWNEDREELIARADGHWPGVLEN